MAKTALRRASSRANPLRPAPRVPAGANSLAAAATPPWIDPKGKRPDLLGYVFVYVRFVGETRDDAEAYRDGYGQSVDSINSWAEVAEYRRKRHAVSL